MMAEVNKLLVIEHSVLAAMAGNPDFLREFPFLSMVNNPISRKSGCNACSRASAGGPALRLQSPWSSRGPV